MTMHRVRALCALLLVSATFLAGCSSSPMGPETRTTVNGQQVKPQMDQTSSKYTVAEN